MTKRKQQKKYTLSEMKDLQRTLCEHDRCLVAEIVYLSKLDGHAAACKMRVEAEKLCAVRSITDPKAGILNTCMSLAEHRGEPQTIPYIEDCGLEE